MDKVDVKCPFCQQTHSVKKHGLGSTGHQRYRCQDCCRSFQLDYEYRACQPDTNDKIIDLTMNNTGIRDTARALNISINIFVHTEPKKRPDGTLTPSVRKMRVDSNTAWREALKRAGIENFRFHDLRHTWVSWLIQSGVPLSVLQEMGGWESVDMVRRYAHLAPNHLTEHAKQIDKYFGTCVPNTSHLRKVENLK